MTEREPAVLVFDVNETLLDIESLQPHFERIFGDTRVLREWFGQLVMYSMALTLSGGQYADFGTLGRAVMQMTAEVHHVNVTDGDLRDFAAGMRTMPAHPPDVAGGLAALRNLGYRMATLTNSPASPDGRTPRCRTRVSVTTSSASSASTRNERSNPPPRSSTPASLTNWVCRPRPP